VIKLASAAFAASLLAATSAFAADLPYAAEPTPVAVPIAFDWTGFYVGAQAGYMWGDVSAPYGAVGGPFDSDQDDFDQDGFVGGVHIGYNAQFNQIVVGLEADAEFSGVEGDDDGSGGDVNGLDHNWMGSVRARLGFAFDNFLPYVTGGVAFLDADATAPVDDDDVTFVGWTVGAGLEYAITQNWSVRAEYRYTDFGSERVSFPDDGYDENLSPELHAVRVGVSYRF
jgi:outer membrane immunogenic protein